MRRRELELIDRKLTARELLDEHQLGVKPPAGDLHQFVVGWRRLRHSAGR